MKFFLLMGGTCGFMLSFAAGVWVGNDVMIALRDAAIGCLLGGLLMRGFFAVFITCVEELAAERAKERRQRESVEN